MYIYIYIYIHTHTHIHIYIYIYIYIHTYTCIRIHIHVVFVCLFACLPVFGEGVLDALRRGPVQRALPQDPQLPAVAGSERRLHVL